MNSDMPPATIASEAMALWHFMKRYVIFSNNNNKDNNSVVVIVAVVIMIMGE